MTIGKTGSGADSVEAEDWPEAGKVVKTGRCYLLETAPPQINLNIFGHSCCTLS